jgi:hypothetical protein
MQGSSWYTFIIRYHICGSMLHYLEHFDTVSYKINRVHRSLSALYPSIHHLLIVVVWLISRMPFISR